MTIVLLSIDLLIYLVEPDELEKWCESNRFGKINEGGWLGFGASTHKYKELKEQDDAFQKAISQVTVRPA
ncbi:hypothetical protein ACQR5T_01420 [Xanthomonas oryzae pv. oryzicola]|uniref:hypothetical protein n=1 Tax=Xanthomonas oryzae TaxID=347 RepID=UPI0012AEED0B|nr:hypothetical protein [Xanthomonas oryzae]